MATQTISAEDDDRMPLMEHLVELRSRIIKCAIAVGLGTVVGLLRYEWIIDLLRGPLKERAGTNVSDQFLAQDPVAPFLFQIKFSVYLGIVVAMPILLWQLWKFIAPGLYQNERRYAVSFVVSASLLFLIGAVIAFLTLPAALQFLQSMGGPNIYFQYSIDKYVMLVVYMMVAFGVGFQFPIVVVFLQLVGVVDPKQLSQFRRFAVVIIFVVAAVITPSADPISLFALAIPMVVFYELSIVIGRVALKRRAKQATQAEVGA